MVDWKAFTLGFIVTLVLVYIGNYIPYLHMTIAPIMGGITAGYVVGGSYKNGIIYGGFSVGIVGFLYSLVVIILLGGIGKATSVSMVIVPLTFNGESAIVTAGIIILGAIISFVMYFISGLIGGLIGVAIKEREAEKQIFRT
jgi:Family of unknown function (DUF5518)